MFGSFGKSFSFGKRKTQATQNAWIVLSNLQYYISAGNTASYSGSGTTITDMSPNAYSATMVNATFDGADSGGTFVFDGSGDYINTNQSLAFENFSICIWFKTQTAGINMLISKETNAGWPWNYRMWLNNGQLVADVAQSSGTFSSLTDNSNYKNGAWQFAVFTRNDSNWYLYKNGVQVQTKADDLTGTVTNSQPVWIGRSAYLGGSYDFTGSISEVLIYDRVLTSSEVLQNYNATKTRFGL